MLDFGRVRGRKFYFVGIKGTGMAALAELLHLDGAQVSGSDVSDTFFTEIALRKRGIPYFDCFAADHVPRDADGVVFSAAYSPDHHPELLRAREYGLPLWNYTQALGLYSRQFSSVGVAGVHGKTTTTALIGVVLRALGVPFRLLTGSLVPDFGDSPVVHDGGEWFVAETCEYRRHFLNFHPRKILLTSLEEDHQDYYPDLASIRDAFGEYLRLLPEGGTLVYCADDANVLDLVRQTLSERPDLSPIPYGFEAPAERWRVVSVEQVPGAVRFRLGGLERTWVLHIPGRHNVLNAAGALALAWSLHQEEFGREPDPVAIDRVVTALGAFRSTYRRSQIVGERGGVLVMDDYAHHPTAIRKTLEGIRSFYRPSRLIVSFMSHTFSRTRALFDDFARSFTDADVLLLHKIYASARESHESGTDGPALAERTRRYHPNVTYFEEFESALPYLEATLRPGDLFLTMGAGDNWKLGRMFLEGSR